MTLWLVLNGLLLMGAYLLGSFPTGYLVGRWLRGIDIREYGSGSTGATNVLRTLGKAPALFVFCTDLSKGAIAIALTRLTYKLPLFVAAAPNGSETFDAWLPWTIVAAGMAALVGHSKSIWLGFRGGKSAATSLGILFAMYWPLGAWTLSVFLLVFATSRIVSLSSIAAAIATPAFAIFTDLPLPFQAFAIAGGAYVLLRHRTNIQRLLDGTEPRVGQQLQANPQNH